MLSLLHPKLIIKDFPQELAKQLDVLVKQFVWDSKISKTSEFEGAVQQTVSEIGHAIFKGGDGYNGDFWIAEEQGKVVAYALCSLSKDIDNKLVYWLQQVYVAPEYRNTQEVKQWYAALEERAKQLNAAHIVLIGSRKPEAYIKFLGKDWHTYATLIKKDLGD